MKKQSQNGLKMRFIQMLNMKMDFVKSQMKAKNHFGVFNCTKQMWD